MRVLVSCESCHRQFDAGKMPVGTKFHCACGEVLKVPSLKAKDAAVVRCSSCGAPRTKASSECKFCEADFTIHEQDLHTICGSCMTRVSDRARFCHNCGAPVVAEGSAGEPTEYACPGCEPSWQLHSRTLGSPPVSILECGKCAGVWIAEEAFELVAERARRNKSALVDLPGPKPGTETRPGQSAVVYRRCPRCRQRMNRRNYGRGSGVIVDQCREHGIWFDCGELEAVLQWVRKGGEQHAKRREQDEQRTAASSKRLTQFRDARERAATQADSFGARDSLLIEVLDSVFSFDWD